MLSEEQMKEMLGKRTKSLLERIETNIRTGFVVILLLIAAILTVDYRTAAMPGKLAAGEDLPGWLFYLDLGVNLLIIALFITFLIHYWRIRQQCRGICDLRQTLTKSIGVLTFYQRLFSLALGIILLVSATGFIAGYFTSIHSHNTSEGFLFPVLVIGILLLALLSGAIFFMLRWAFRRVYGNYLRQLRNTLSELNELKE